MTGLESVLTGSLLFVGGMTITAVTSNFNKVSKKEHKQDHVEFLETHDKECDLKLSPVYEKLERIEAQNVIQFKEQIKHGNILSVVAEKVKEL